MFIFLITEKFNNQLYASFIIVDKHLQSLITFSHPSPLTAAHLAPLA